MKNSSKKFCSESSHNIFAVLLVISLLTACGSDSTLTIIDDTTNESQTDGSGAGSGEGVVYQGSTDSNGEAGTDEGENANGADAGDMSDGGTGSPVDPTPFELTPIARAPADAQIFQSESLDLDGSVTYDAMLQGIPVIEWVKLSGPGNALFLDSNSAATSVSFDQVGSYSLELKASNGSYDSTDQMSIIVVADAVNQSPAVNAGADETLNIDEVFNLSAVIDDDGLPTNTLDGSWAKISGSGEVTFGEATAAETSASFSATGNYILQFTVSDGELSSNDAIGITVTDSSLTDASDNINAANNWEVVATSDGSLAQARHEAGAVALDGKLYLMGGRGIRQMNRYDPATNSWENFGSPSFQFNHFQPVVYDDKIYVLGALNCCYPSETIIDAIKIFDPVSNVWSQGADLPQNRLRGSAGTVLYNNKMYLVGGSTNGHDGGMVNWFDEYDPSNDTWVTLPNAPSQRDHFSAAVIGDKLIAAGGRQTEQPNSFRNLVADVDIYDFTTGSWTTGASIPTPRAGAMTVSYGDEVILVGGEIDTGNDAVSVVEAYNVKTNTWRTLDSLNTARHSGGAAIVDGSIHVVSGNIETGGGNETQAHELLELD